MNVKYRKFTIFWAVMVVISVLLSSCSSDSTQTTPSGPPALEGTPESMLTPAESLTEKKIKVALVLDGKIDDSGWNQAGYEGLKESENQFVIQTAFAEEIPDTDFENALRDYANQGFNLIICHSSIAKEAVMNAARDYPDTAFLWSDGDETANNVAVLKPMAQESSYLAGIIAGKMTTSNRVGMVGGIDKPSTHRSYVAFEQGLKEVNPNAELMVNWTGDFLDANKGKEAALSQIESGVDIIFANGDGHNIGVLQVASEKNVLAIGAVRDQFNVAPNVVLTSVEWGFKKGIPMVVKDYINGTFEGKIYPMSLINGAELSPYHDSETKIPADVTDLINQKRDEILNGSLIIPEVDY